MKITGNISLIADVLKTLEGKERKDRGVFKALVGIQPGMDKKVYDEGGWYDANVGYWGTKWDVPYNQENHFDIYDDKILVSFSTAWSPPIKFCITLSKQYGVRVEMTFRESGGDFCGRIVVEEGVMIEQQEYEYYEGLHELFPEDFLLEVEQYMEWNPEMKFEEIQTRLFPYLKDEKEICKLIELYDNAVKNANQKTV